MGYSASYTVHRRHPSALLVQLNRWSGSEPCAVDRTLSKGVHCRGQTVHCELLVSAFPDGWGGGGVLNKHTVGSGLTVLLIAFALGFRVFIYIEVMHIAIVRTEKTPQLNTRN